MRYIYMVETKTFYVDGYGTDHQVADLGTLPHVFTSFREGVEMMQLKRRLHTKDYHETLTKNYGHKDLDTANCYDRFETRDERTGSRTIVSLYKVVIS